jgi:hypothetical protein
MDEIDVVVVEDEPPGEPDPFSPECEAQLCEQVLGDARHGL